MICKTETITKLNNFNPNRKALEIGVHLCAAHFLTYDFQFFRFLVLSWIRNSWFIIGFVENSILLIDLSTTRFCSIYNATQCEKKTNKKIDPIWWRGRGWRSTTGSYTWTGCANTCSIAGQLPAGIGLHSSRGYRSLLQQCTGKLSDSYYWYKNIYRHIYRYMF